MRRNIYDCELYTLERKNAKIIWSSAADNSLGTIFETHLRKYFENINIEYSGYIYDHF